MIHKLLLQAACFILVPLWALADTPPLKSLFFPKVFMENNGQVHTPNGDPCPDVLFQLAASRGINISLTKNAIRYSFLRKKDTAASDSVSPVYETTGLDVTLLGTNPNVQITPEERSTFYKNYYQPGCGVNGITNVHGYSRIVYHDIYPNIDWIVYLQQGDNAKAIKYDFVVRPGGNAADIRLQYGKGASLKIQNDGSLQVATSLATLMEQKPCCYTKSDNRVHRSAYNVKGNIVSYEIKRPKSDETLVIDPQVIWATYLGGNDEDYGNSAVCDNEGNVLICGSTLSNANLATPNGYASTLSGVGDAFVAKLDVHGAPLWITYYGGPSGEDGWAVAVDTVKNVFLCGSTRSKTGIATAGTHQQLLNGDTTIPSPPSDVFIAKFTPSGTRIWGTYFGGSSQDALYAGACDSNGNVYITGKTTSSNLIATPGAFKSSFSYVADTEDAFIAKFDSSGNRLWGTYFGAGNREWAVGLCLDNSSNVFITGYTMSYTGLASPGAYQTSPGPNWNQLYSFLAKFSSSGSRLWSTYYGEGWGQGVTCDNNGNVYLTGISGNIPGMTTTGTQQPTYGGGGTDAYIAKFNPSGSRVWGTFYGGAKREDATNAWIKYSSNVQLYPKWTSCYVGGKLWVGGISESDTVMATKGAYQDTLGGGGSMDVVLATFDPVTGKRLWGSYFGGRGVEHNGFITGSVTGHVYLVGTTISKNGIATTAAYQGSMNGTFDPFLLQLYDTAEGIYLTPPPRLCSGDTLRLNYSIAHGGTMQLLNVFTAQLSNATGSFATPTTIGTLASPVSGIITCVLPAGISGTGYKIRVVSSIAPWISDSISVVINPLPSPVISYSGGVLSTTTPFSSYQWYSGSAPIAGATSRSYKPSVTGTYTVVVTNANGCKGSASYNTALGVEQELTEEPSLKVAPNPVGDGRFTITVESPKAISVVNVDIINANGSTVFSAQYPNRTKSFSRTIDLGKVAKGIYYVRINADGETRARRLIMD